MLCNWCHKNFMGRPNRKYCSSKCKKSKEISSRRAPGKRKKGISVGADIDKPQQLDGYASAFWEKTAPMLIKRGLLNVLTADSFAELCDVAARLRDINIQINESGRSLLEPVEKSDDKRRDKAGSQKGAINESALSNLKRKYSNLLLIYCKNFLMTPLSNHGSFGVPDEQEDLFDKFMRGKNGK